jgi:hypothetical protein
MSETFTHDDLVARVPAAVARLDLARVVEGFVAGVGGSAPRGRKTLVSWLKLRWIVEHPYRAVERMGSCGVCGLPREAILDVDAVLRDYALGQCWNEPDPGWVFDLCDAADRAPLVARAQDWHRLAALLRFLDTRAPEATAGAVAKEVVRAKLLPLKGRSAHYAVYGIGQALGELGVLPNPLLTPALDAYVSHEAFGAAERAKGGSHRSDLVVPFGAWRGSLGVAWERARLLFSGLSLE